MKIGQWHPLEILENVVAQVVDHRLAEFELMPLPQMQSTSAVNAIRLRKPTVSSTVSR